MMFLPDMVGEEFIVLAPRTSLADAADLARRIAKKISDAAMPFDGQITCSFGVAQFRPESDAPDTIFDRVDMALYKSKNSGKSCVTEEDS